jgi:hypothetical protein
LFLSRYIVVIVVTEPEPCIWDSARVNGIITIVNKPNAAAAASLELTNL